MKRLFFLFGLSALSAGVQAQNSGIQGHVHNNYGVSVFSRMPQHPVKRADAGVQAKLQARFPSWYIGTDEWSGGFRELNGPAITVSGSSYEEKARNVMATQLSVVGINASEWKLVEQKVNTKGFTLLFFTQIVGGKDVAFTRLNFRFTPDGKLARVVMKGFGAPDASLTPSVSADKALLVALQGMDDATFHTKSIASDWEWFPVPSAKGYTLHPAYKFSAEGRSQATGSVPLNMSGYVDAITGDLLYRENEVLDAANLKVSGTIATNGYTNPWEFTGLPFVTAKIGSTTVQANDTGFINFPVATLPSTMTVSLEGKWSVVKSAPDGSITPSFTRTVSALGTTDSFPAASKATIRHINAYYHVNTVHDFMKSKYGTTFTAMDFPLTTNVDVTGTCNAFYTAAGGGSINFFPDGGGCVSFALVRDVVYHEYGHAIVSRMYSGGMRNGALNEGQADVWGMSITKSAILGQGSSAGSPLSSIRRYDLAPKVYPRDIVGEVHGDGEIIAGAWWDYGVNVGSVDLMSTLFAQTLFDKPDGPNGTEGEVYFEMLMDALINDDDDGNLSNGTPHFAALVTAFAKHGIYLLQNITLTHNEVPHQSKATATTINAKLTIPYPSFFKQLNLVYRNARLAGTKWDTVKMTDLSGGNFTAIIPGQSEGTIVDYYFSAEDALNQQGVFFPEYYYPSVVLSEAKSNIPYQYGVGLSVKEKVDFESTLTGWQLGLADDNATSGKWIQAVPIGSTTSSGLASQTDADHTSGSGKCLVTGNATSLIDNVYSASVKNGMTSAVTPLYDMSGYKNPVVEYYRWYGNDRGRNPKDYSWRVQMSTGSTIFFRDVENTNQADYSWRRKMFKPFDIYPGSSKMQIKFTASETPSSSGNGLVEAAVDDFVIYEGEESSSVIDEQKALAAIYPNPASGTLNIALPAGSYDEVSIRFYDLGGRMTHMVPTTKGGTRYAVNTIGMVPGQYLVVVQMDKTIQTQKVTITAQ